MLLSFKGSQINLDVTLISPLLHWDSLPPSKSVAMTTRNEVCSIEIHSTQNCNQLVTRSTKSQQIFSYRNTSEHASPSKRKHSDKHLFRITDNLHCQTSEKLTTDHIFWMADNFLMSNSHTNAYPQIKHITSPIILLAVF